MNSHRRFHLLLNLPLLQLPAPIQTPLLLQESEDVFSPAIHSLRQPNMFESRIGTAGEAGLDEDHHFHDIWTIFVSKLGDELAVLGGGRLNTRGELEELSRRPEEEMKVNLQGGWEGSRLFPFGSFQ